MAINDIINESWQGHSHGEVEDALKAALLKLAQDIENYTIQPNSVTAVMLSADVRDVIVNAVPNSRTINGKSLAGNITLKTSDIQNDSGYVTQDDLPESATPDNAMSGDSENAVQNKVIKAYVDAAVSAVNEALTNLIGSGYEFGPIKTFSDVISFLNGINNSETLAQKLMLKADVLDVYAKSETYNRSQVYNKGEVDTKVAEAVKGLGGGTVKSVSVNDGEIVPPDPQTGNVNLLVEGTQGAPGPAGKSAYEIAVEEGFVGSKADWLASLIGSCAITGNGSNIIALIVNDLVTGGAGNILSAEMGKLLGQQILAGTGTYAEAFNKSKTFSSFFPWLLDEVDDGGNRIRKMIWHIGNHEFIDAIGSVITGKRYGITIISDGNGVLKVYGGGYEGTTNNGANVTPEEAMPVGNPAELAFSAGETNFDFDDIVNAFITANQSLYETAVANTGNTTTLEKIYTAIKNYDGKTLACSSPTFNGRGSGERNSVFDITVDSEDAGKATYVDLEFNGVTIVGATCYHGNNTYEGGYAGGVDIMYVKSSGNSLIRDVKGLTVECDFLEAFAGCPNLRNVEIKGYVNRLCRIVNNSGPVNGLETLDLSNLEVKSTCTTLGLLLGASSGKILTSIDLRKFDTSSVTSFNGMFGNCSALKTIIIGNFSNAATTAVDKFFVYANSAASPYTGVTLVCTTDEPPVLNSSYDWVENHFSVIRVPNKTVEVNGVDTPLIDVYKSAAGWSTYADIMETYEDWEY